MFFRMGFSLKGLLFDVIGIFELLIIIRVVLSWVARDTRAHYITYRLTEPAVAPVRRTLDRITGQLPIDISPAVTIAVLELLGWLVSRLLR